MWISGANVAECAPITTDYVWQAREHGARVIVVDPRITPIARTCDLFLPIKPGRDVALFNGTPQNGHPTVLFHSNAGTPVTLVSEMQNSPLPGFVMRRR